MYLKLVFFLFCFPVCFLVSCFICDLGLKNSRLFIALISSAALTNVRDYSRDHAKDNVLLEYEIALKVALIFVEVYFSFVPF